MLLAPLSGVELAGCLLRRPLRINTSENEGMGAGKSRGRGWCCKDGPMIAQLSPQCALELEWPMGLCPERPSVTHVGQPGVPVTSGEVALQLGRHILPCRGARGCIPRPP